MCGEDWGEGKDLLSNMICWFGSPERKTLRIREKVLGLTGVA